MHLFYNAEDLMVYMVQNMSVDHKDKKLNRYSHDLLRRSFL